MIPKVLGTPVTGGGTTTPGKSPSINAPAKPKTPSVPPRDTGQPFGGPYNGPNTSYPKKAYGVPR